MTRWLFSAGDGVQGSGHGAELWITDGTAAGTYLLDDINPGSNSSAPTSFVALGGEVLFAAQGSTNNTELWITDGTAAGTSILTDINPAGSSRPQYPVAIGGRAVFVANDGTHGAEMWTTDGTANGTYLLKDINPGSASANVPLHFSMLKNGGDVLFWA